MKLALVSPYDFAFPGGVTSHIEHLAREFVRLGHNVWVIAPSSDPSTAIEGASFARFGVPVPVPTGGSVARVCFSPWLLHRVSALLARERFDVVHVHEPLAPLLPWLVLHCSRTLNIGTFHAFHGRSRLYPLARRLLGHWYARLHGRIAVSQSARRFVESQFGGEFAVIPNGIDVTQFSEPQEPIHWLADGRPNILWVGRLEKRKGLKYLLMAYSRLKWDHPEARLVVVGPGAPDRDSYRVIAEHGLRDVHFVGAVPWTELSRYYQSSHIFCTPATGKESFGIVLLEAMAAGKPIVASNIEGYVAVLEDGVQGILAPPKDDIALAQALKTLLENPGLRARMGTAGLVRARQFSWPIVASRVLEYYGVSRERLLSRGLAARLPPAA